VTLCIIAVVVVLATCGFGSYLLVRDERSVVGASPSASASVIHRDLADRKADPKALTANDVFPTTEITVDPSIPPYKRLGLPQVAKDCRVAATADLGKLLVSLGCNQVVRATFSSPDGAYLVTGGIFNLRDHVAAVTAHDQIKSIIDSGKGRFSGYISTFATKIFGRALSTQPAWDAEGHFLVYCVIARIDGKKFAADDPHLPVMIYDIAERYLRDHVIEQWSIGHSTPTAGPPPSPTG
jgi:hypothetical protein